jgi:hypothetical protein
MGAKKNKKFKSLCMQEGSSYIKSEIKILKGHEIYAYEVTSLHLIA